MTYSPIAYQSPAYSAARDPVDWWAESRVAAVVAVFAALLGAAVGPIWHALAPQVHIVAAAKGSSAATKALLGDDMWLGLLGIVAGVLCVVVLVIVAPQASNGPGAQVGLVVGGALGMLVAARVGHRIGHEDLADLVRMQVPRGGQHAVNVLLGYFDFKVRAAAVLVTWPLASIIVSANTAWFRANKQPTRAVSPSYPGSS